MGNYVEFKPHYESKNECYLTALCACFNIDYNEAKKSGITSRNSTIEKYLQGKGYEAISFLTMWKGEQVTLKEFCNQYKVGIYYVLLVDRRNRANTGHAVAVIDGTVYDSWDSYSNTNYVVEKAYVISDKRANIGKTLDVLELAKYARKYILLNSKDGIIPGITLTGTNEFSISKNNKTYYFAIPINFNERQAINYIEKECKKIR